MFSNKYIMGMIFHWLKILITLFIYSILGVALLTNINTVIIGLVVLIIMYDRVD